mmetsp:Transcript_73639/g.134613  ORF Transcript_73639/g.134613 Transcript_73639/m.134613 type:complete len:378 (+) Transcript_73639:94-1227(+)
MSNQAVATPFRSQRAVCVVEEGQEERLGSTSSPADLTTPLAKGTKRPRTGEDVLRSGLRPRKLNCLRTRHQDGPTAQMRALEAVVVNLERRPDRMDGCRARLKRHCSWLQHSRFTASDGRKDVIRADEVVNSWHTGANVKYQKLRAIRKGWNDLDTYQERTLELSPGERGCAMSHIRAWRYCLEHCGEEERPLLVLEDDAAPTAQFTEGLKAALAPLPGDAHLLYLGYSQAADWKREISTSLVEAEYVWTTVGYIVWPAGARILLNRLPIDQPVDNWMASLCASGDIKAYCVRPKIVRQAEAWNVNSDVAHSDEHYWGPCSDIHHSDEFYWGAPNHSDADGAALDGQPERVNSMASIWPSNIDDADSEDTEDEEGGL